MTQNKHDHHEPAAPSVGCLNTLRVRAAVPVADVAGAIFVRGAAGAAADAVHILVALGRILGEVDPRSEHSPDVGVSLVKTLVDDRVDEGRACAGEEKHTRRTTCVRF